MAAVFPLDTSNPWTFNGVTYRYDATEDRWFVISTNKTDFVDDSIETLVGDIDVINTIIDQEIENRSSLLDAAATKNNQQDASIAELDSRVDAISSASGSLAFKGRFQYVLEKSEAACTAVYAACLVEAQGDPIAGSACNTQNVQCVQAIDEPYPDGTFTSKGATNVMADIEEFVVSEKDLDSLVFDWLNLVEVDDYLEFFEEADGDTALYQVIEEPKVFNTSRSIRVKFLTETGAGDGKFNLQEIYDLRVFKGSQGIDLSEADQRYVLKPYVVYFEDTPSDITPVHPSGNLRNGELWFDTSSLEMFVWNNNAWVATSPPPSQDIVVQSVVAEVDRLSEEAYVTNQTLNSLQADLLLENNIYYSDDTPAGDIYGTLRNGDIWIDSNDLTIKFYSGGVWVNPDRTVGGDYLEKSGGTMTGPLSLVPPTENEHAINRGYANTTYLRDGFQANQTINFRTGGTSNAPFKITNQTGGATLLKIDASGGKDNPIKYVVDNGVTHSFVGKVAFERVGNERSGFVIEGRKTDGTIGDMLQVYHNGGSVADAVNYFGKITSDSNIVNKKYVDDAVGTGGAVADTNQPPPGRVFKKINATSPTDSGGFTYYETSGQLKLGLNRRDVEGIKWLDINFNDSLAAPVLFRIVELTNDTTHTTIRYGAIDKIVASEGGQVVCDVKYHATNGSMTNGSNYYITIGGLI